MVTGGFQGAGRSCVYKVSLGMRYPHSRFSAYHLCDSKKRTQSITKPRAPELSLQQQITTAI